MGHLAYRLSLLSVRFAGRTSASVRVAEFVAARPDPLRDHAQAVLQHLERAHAGELLACLHAHGLHDALAVVPRGLDRYGVSSAPCAATGSEAYAWSSRTARWIGSRKWRWGCASS
jgi:hypothetical protein